MREKQGNCRGRYRNRWMDRVKENIEKSGGKAAEILKEGNDWWRDRQ